MPADSLTALVRHLQLNKPLHSSSKQNVQQHDGCQQSLSYSLGGFEGSRQATAQQYLVNQWAAASYQLPANEYCEAWLTKEVVAAAQATHPLLTITQDISWGVYLHEKEMCQLLRDHGIPDSQPVSRRQANRLPSRRRHCQCWQYQGAAPKVGSGTLA